MTVGYVFEAGCASFELQAPERGNALDLPLLQAFEGRVQQARADDARVVLLRAAGDAGCVGGDPGAVAETPAPGQLIEAMAESIHRSVSALIRRDAVVVSAVQGTAAGAGVPLAAADVASRRRARASCWPTPATGSRRTAACRCCTRAWGCTARCTWRCSTRCSRAAMHRPSGSWRTSTPTTSRRSSWRCSSAARSRHLRAAAPDEQSQLSDAAQPAPAA